MDILLPETSEKSETVLIQLMKAKAEMGSGVKKDANNPFHKNKYATLGAHLDLSESILAKHGLIMLHTVNVINNQNILVATLHHPESGQWIKSYLPLPNPKADSQGVGASLTYMRRYSINSMLGLSAEDDDGETASGRGNYNKSIPQDPSVSSKEDKKAKPLEQIAKIGKAEIIHINNLIQQLDEVSSTLFLSWIKKTYNADTIQDIPKNGFQTCVVSLNAKIKYLKDQQKNMAVA